MNAEPLLAIRGRALNLARRNESADLADDFASYCVIRAIECNDIFWGTVWVDYLRTTFGRSKRGEGKEQKIIEYDPERHESKIKRNALVVAADGLEMNERVVFLLHLQVGLELDEIGTLFGVETAMVSRVYCLALDFIKRREL